MGLWDISLGGKNIGNKWIRFTRAVRERTRTSGDAKESDEV